ELNLKIAFFLIFDSDSNNFCSEASLASLFQNCPKYCKEGGHYKLLCSPKAEEQVDFDNRLSQLINKATSHGQKAKGELL
ncbi:hypothetical protein, partial [Microcoleus sp. S11D4]